MDGSFIEDTGNLQYLKLTEESSIIDSEDIKSQ